MIDQAGTGTEPSWQKAFNSLLADDRTGLGLRRSQRRNRQYPATLDYRHFGRNTSNRDLGVEATARAMS